VCVATIKAGRPSSQSHGDGQMPIAYPVSICLEVQPLFFMKDMKRQLPEISIEKIRVFT
jgi:hypothetical protein